jgi:polysaccharide export outer membrane protein
MTKLKSFRLNRAPLVLSFVLGMSMFLTLRAQDVSTEPVAQPAVEAENPVTDSPAASGDKGVAMTSSRDAEHYLISPEDELEIYVLDVPEISRTYRVTPSGEITVPLIQDPIVAAGLSPSKLAEVIKDDLKKAGMVEHAHVSVQVHKSRLHAIAIAGAVKRPQMYPVFGRTTVLDALSQAEGLDTTAGNTAIITRGALAGSEVGKPGAEQQASLEANKTVKIDLKALLEDGDPTQNVYLYPGDRITVQRAGIVYVVGAVNKAGGYVLANDREEMTILKAVALAMNVTSTAVPKKTLIIRKNPKVPGASEDIPVPLDKILSGKEQDKRLMANDILFIPDSKAKKALHEVGKAAVNGAALMFYRVP